MTTDGGDLEDHHSPSDGSDGAHGSDDDGPSTDGDGAHGVAADSSTKRRGPPPPPPSRGEGLVTLRKILRVYGLEEEKTPKDNNCLFHALVMQLRRLELYHGDARKLRKTIVEHMLSIADVRIDKEHDNGRGSTLRNFVHNESWETYMETMATHGVGWGDNLVLISAGEGPHRAHSVV